MASASKWNKITSKMYSYEGEFYPMQLYEDIKQYLEDKQYDIDESEVEMQNMDGKIRIFTHLLAELEYSRRYYIKIAFSINMEGKIIDSKTHKVNGKLVLHANGFVQKHSLLHEKKSTPITIFLTNLYDNFLNRDEMGNTIMNTVIEVGKLIAEVKSHVHKK